jgi:hypothetical protein
MNYNECGLMDVLYRHLPGGTGEICQDNQDIQCPGRNSNRSHPESKLEKSVTTWANLLSILTCLMNSWTCYISGLRMNEWAGNQYFQCQMFTAHWNETLQRVFILEPYLTHKSRTVRILCIFSTPCITWGGVLVGNQTAVKPRVTVDCFPIQ